ncbi:MAG TPA: histidine phosphatase family protein [Gaiellaceae bacterium]|nr:histidine phosphatase family protein [Gaiellaceae bacterium]
METLFLARHALAGSNRDGTASSRAPGEGLTEAGREQARRLGAQLSGEPIELGMATPFRRTQETLALALAGRGVPRAVVAELGEIRFGAFDGGPLADYREWAASSSPSAPAPGGGESRAQAAARFARGLELVLARPERTVLVVAHALVVRYVLDAARGLVPAARMEAVEHAVPARLSATEVAAAAELLAGWSLAPRFRAPSDGG